MGRKSKKVTTGSDKKVEEVTRTRKSQKEREHMAPTLADLAENPSLNLTPYTKGANEKPVKSWTPTATLEGSAEGARVSIPAKPSQGLMLLLTHYTFIVRLAFCLCRKLMVLECKQQANCKRERSLGACGELSQLSSFLPEEFLVQRPLTMSSGAAVQEKWVCGPDGVSAVTKVDGPAKLFSEFLRGAVGNNQKDVVHQLISRLRVDLAGSDWNVTGVARPGFRSSYHNQQRLSLLELAAGCGHFEMFQLRGGAVVYPSAAATSTGYVSTAHTTLLHSAIRGNSYPLVRVLLQDYGAAPNSTANTVEGSPLQIAAHVGKSKVVGLLLASGADKEWQLPASTLGYERILQGSPLRIATDLGHAEVVALLE